MARRVFFSFHYQRDILRANVVRNCGIVEGSAAAGFHDASLWEKAKTQGDATVKRLIDKGLEGTSVTAVLIGAQTAARQYVDYEIEQSIKRGNGLLGIYIHQIGIPYPDTQGVIPWRLFGTGNPVYYWNRENFGGWVEEAYQRSQINTQPAYIPSETFAQTLQSLGFGQPPPTYQPSDALTDILKKYLK